MTPIRRVLIANRGEIAIRIARAAHERGLSVAGVYSEADANALFRTHLDASVCIGAGPAVDSYLDGERIIAAAKTLGADAVHPGYGFLSERATFARAVLDAGLRFIGPSPEAIAAMGSKIEAKRRVRDAGVPVVPGYDGDDQSDARLRAEAEQVGMPLLIKASAGGGGRGMRVVASMAEFDEALVSARREARAAFGDDAMLLERYLARPRHIEFQIFGDAHGTIVHLGERECSIQRRHQKVIEEAPSVALDPALRAEMGAAAIRAAASVRYTSAGTAEFMLDEDGRFYFLEMNARLQVEHPVTELVYGVDLVSLQFAVADGEALPFTQDELQPRGWAIEARLNAEDPSRDGMPSSGTIRRFTVPALPGIRVDTGVADGSEVPVFYDSLLAKIIAWGPSRDIATQRLAAALAGSLVEPLPTNLPLLCAILDDADFRRGALSTRFLDDHHLTAAPAHAGDDAITLAAAAVAIRSETWRAAGIGIPIGFTHDTRTLAGHADLHRDRLDLSGDFRGAYSIESDGDVIALQATGGGTITGTVAVDGTGVTVFSRGRVTRLTFAAPPSPEAQASAGSTAAGVVTAPMPGKIASVAAVLGASVEEHDVLVVLEAMKMEHRIEAPAAGVVAEVHVRAGEIVGAGKRLVTLA